MRVFLVEFIPNKHRFKKLSVFSIKTAENKLKFLTLIQLCMVENF